MKVCIVCSLSMEEECRKATETLVRMGFDVVRPFEVQEAYSLYLVQKKYLELIESSDMVLVIPKYFVYNNGDPKEHKITEDYSVFDFIVGESVSYEIAYARKIGKPVIFGMLPFVEEREDNYNVSRDDAALCQGGLFWQSVEEKGV